MDSSEPFMAFTGLFGLAFLGLFGLFCTDKLRQSLAAFNGLFAHFAHFGHFGHFGYFGHFDLSYKY
jgi:hypothetical protein